MRINVRLKNLTMVKKIDKFEFEALIMSSLKDYILSCYFITISTGILSCLAQLPCSCINSAVFLHAALLLNNRNSLA